MITENRQTVKMCTGDMASRITGLELCGELQYPNASTTANGPYFPFTGPTSFSVTLYKRDTLTSYKLLAKRVEVSARSPRVPCARAVSLNSTWFVCTVRV